MVRSFVPASQNPPLMAVSGLSVTVFTSTPFWLFRIISRSFWLFLTVSLPGWVCRLAPSSTVAGEGFFPLPSGSVKHHCRVRSLCPFPPPDTDVAHAAGIHFLPNCLIPQRLLCRTFPRDSAPSPCFLFLSSPCFPLPEQPVSLRYLPPLGSLQDTQIHCVVTVFRWLAWSLELLDCLIQRWCWGFPSPSL